jgi:hypothetical protein
MKTEQETPTKANYVFLLTVLIAQLLGFLIGALIALITS